MGAIDGKHIAIRKPANSGSLYYNYKGFYSIVLLAVVNAIKEFIMIDAGINGKISDGGVLFYSKLGELMEKNGLNLPQPKSLPKTDDLYPYVFVADNAFPLGVNLMKPYQEKCLTPAKELFNKRLSAARATVENAFGVLASRFGVFQKAMNLEPAKTTSVTMASCYLHNYLAKENNKTYFSGQEEMNEELLVNLRTMARNSTSNAKMVRDKFCQYYINEGVNM